MGAADDDDEQDPNETTPFIPGSASTPGPPGEEIPMQTMQHEKSGLPVSSYEETSFGGVQSRSADTWVAAKNIFPNMSSSELDVFYDTKGRLKVKMFGPGKGIYDMFTTTKGTGEQRINKNLSKEIKTALGKSIYEIEKEKQKSLVAEREKYKKAMEEKREEIKRKRLEKEALEDKDGHSEQVQKLDQEIRYLETERREANVSYLKIVEAEREEIQVFEDEEEEVNLNEALNAIRKRKEAIHWRMDVENSILSSKLESPERKEMAQNKIIVLRESYKKVMEDEKMIKKNLMIIFLNCKKTEKNWNAKIKKT